MYIIRVALLLFLLLKFYFAKSQDLIFLTCDDAINIALSESYTIKSHLENKKAMQNYYIYNKAQFKPRLDINTFTPIWNESVTQINQADGLPVYNSTGSFRIGSDLIFTYVLPTGGNLSLHTILYQERVKTALSNQDYDILTNDQIYTQVGISFEQPIFTKNKLSENLKEAEYTYQKSLNYYTKGQMDIVYNVTNGFYALYGATREVEIKKEKIKNSEETYRISKLKFNAKRIAESEVLIAEIEVEQNKAKLSESYGNLEREKDIFKQLIGLKLNQEIEIITHIQYDTIDIDLNKAIEVAIKNRFELKDADLSISLQNIELERAKREKEFKGSISGYYDITGLGASQGAKTGELFNKSLNNFVDRPPNRAMTLTLTYPIYDWGRGSAKVNEKRATLLNLKLEKDNIKTTIIREVRDIVRTVEESKQRLAINEKNLNLVNRSYKISLLRFENGEISSQQLGQEQERISDVQFAFLRSYISYMMAIADLKRKTMWDFENNRSYFIPKMIDN